MNDQDLSISKGIIQSISKLKQNHQFEDFIVEVDGDNYSCHSLILASCSEFFSGLLRTDMKEKIEMKVTLTNISSPIFQLILNSLYTGSKLLIKENVLEVWSAVHQLQIQFLIEHCEDFVESNLSLETLEAYEQHAKYLQSMRICRYIFIFKCTNFEAFSKTKAMLLLNFQELIEIIKSDQLKVRSEDEVLFSIFEWASYGDLMASNCGAIEDVSPVKILDSSQSSLRDTPSSVTCLEKINDKIQQEFAQSTNSNKENEPTDTVLNKNESNERKNMLIELLKSTRYCLASKFCIIQLYENKLTQNDTKVKDILFQALSFKSSGYCHGFCPTSAIHRDCSNFRHIGVYCDSDTVKTFCFQKCNTFSISNLPCRRYSDLTFHNGDIYAFLEDCNEIVILLRNRWELVTSIHSYYCLIISNDKYIYSFDRQKMTRFNPNNKFSEVETFLYNIRNIQYALSFHNNIVVFSTVSGVTKDNINVEITYVYSWSTKTQLWTELGSLNFSSLNMTSFCNESDTYILDSNGNLWKLTNSERIGFTFIKRLWSKNHELKGAVLFKDKLVIVAKVPDDSYDFGTLDKVDGVFSLIQFRQVTSITSNFIHYVIPTM